MGGGEKGEKKELMNDKQSRMGVIGEQKKGGMKEAKEGKREGREGGRKKERKMEGINEESR